MSLARSIKLTPPQLLTSIFGGGIIIGALLLMLPFSTTEPISWIDALFTSTSAMTVTGLAVVDTGTLFTVFGQTIIMLLIQVGGLGIMSFAVLIFIMLGKKIGFKERMMVQHALNQTNIGGVILLVKRRLSTVYVVKALAISMIAIMFVFFATFAINISEPNTPFLKLMFEVVSAFGTVGLSMGVTPELSYVGRVIIIFIMFLGKIGPLTLAFSLAKPKREKIRYPNEDVLIG
ncbi:potassium transporter TrkG [Priestia flexa]|uniref:potassium transporter TrkG n=1 Tax=Priestia flexa TaxID=86664 RepID=UPI00077C34E7|nr:potassium transporter TrkG [Priestia flexa]MED4587345.1 potassium transporter TrkG [Priestia flexa]